MKIVILVIGIIIMSFIAGKFLVSKTNTTPISAGVDEKINSVSPEQFSALLNSGKYVLLDIRTAEEYSSGHLQNAHQIDFYQTQKFSDYLDSLDKSKNYLIYCRAGNRSRSALKIMQEKGFTNVKDLAGGYSAWIAAGLPTQ